MLKQRWNYEEQRYEKWARPSEGEPEQWMEDLNHTMDLRAAFNAKAFQEALVASENWSWANLCKRWGYTKAYLNRLIDTMVREDIANLGKPSAYYRTLLELEPNDPVLKTKKAQTEIAKWENLIEATKKKLRTRPDETRQEMKARMGQVERTENIFAALGMKLP